MTKGIYGYFDKKNDKIVYVGKDSNIHKDERYKRHFQPSKYDEQQINRVLQNNPDRYEYRVLAELSDNFSDNNLNNLERYLIRKYKTYHDEHPDGFNFTRGGDGTSGYKLTEEHKRKISEKLTGKKPSGKTRRKMSEKAKENWKDKEYREKRIGKNHPMYGRTGENHPFYDKHHSEEHKKKMSEIKNTTGYYRVSKNKSKQHKQGFTWVYQYYQNRKYKRLSSVNLLKLKNKVEAQNLPWEIVDEEKAQKSLEENNTIFGFGD